MSGPAGRDLQNISVFASQFDEEAAHRLVTRLGRKFVELASKGVEGLSRPFLPEKVRAFPFEKHCFYFVVDDDALTLVRVRHGAQDTTSIVFEAPDNEE